MSNIKGSFFPYQVIPAKALGAFGAKAVRDGVLDGCGVSYVGTALTIGKGLLIACGRVMEISGDVTLAVDGATSGYARVSVLIDTTKTSTRDAFEQADFLVEYSSTEDGFAEVYAEDINIDGTLYQLVLCVVSLSATGISAVVETSRPALGRGPEWKVIWENASPASAFAEQTLTFEDLSPYGRFEITFVKNNGNFTRTVVICDTENTMEKVSFNCADAVVTENWGVTVRERVVYIDRGENTIKFSTGWCGGETVGESTATMIPICIKAKEI